MCGVLCVLFMSQEVIKDFERNYSDMVGSFMESVQSQYPHHPGMTSCLQEQGEYPRTTLGD